MARNIDDDSFTITLVGSDEWDDVENLDDDTLDSDPLDDDDDDDDTVDDAHTASVSPRDLYSDQGKSPFYATFDNLDLDLDVDVDDNRDIEDFNFLDIIDSFPLSNVPGILAAIEAEKTPYIKAARRAGHSKPLSDFYNEVNVPVFRRRKELQDTVARIKALKRPRAEHARQLEKAERGIEYLTELLAVFNRPIAKAYVRKFTSNTSAEDSADFQGAANVGLMHAIHTFDPDKGKFGSWVYKPLQRAVLKAVQQADFSNMTGGDFERRPAILKAFNDLSEEDPDTTPSYSAVAQVAGVTESLVKRVLAAPHIESLHINVGEEGDTELGDLIPDDTRALEDTVVSGLEVEALKNYGLPLLDRRQRYVIVCRYGLHGEPPEALADIGKNLGLSREAVRQIAAKAMAHLTHPAVLGALVRGGPPER